MVNDKDEEVERPLPRETAVAPHVAQAPHGPKAAPKTTEDRHPKAAPASRAVEEEASDEFPTERTRRADDEHEKEATPREATSDKGGKPTAATAAARKRPVKNNVRKIRMEKMMSKAELARRAGMSTLTIDRVERGLPCRMDTKRKILEALGLKPADRLMVFGEDD
jgi:DNA-binding XRE family transcriptional regulator